MTSTENPTTLALSETKFQEASPSQKEASWRLNAVEWKGPLTLDQYLGREVLLGNQNLTSNGRGKYWVLTPAKNPEEVIASCETIQKAVLTSDGSGFKVLNGYSIASVYTNPKYRRQGMAAHLMKQLQGWFDGEGNADLSVLYSDIGLV
jgi:GNAT superfamily N-acetyltransferase